MVYKQKNNTDIFIILLIGKDKQNDFILKREKLLHVNHIDRTLPCTWVHARAPTSARAGVKPRLHQPTPSTHDTTNLTSTNAHTYTHARAHAHTYMCPRLDSILHSSPSGPPPAHVFQQPASPPRFYTSSHDLTCLCSRFQFHLDRTKVLVVTWINVCVARQRGENNFLK